MKTIFTEMLIKVQQMDKQTDKCTQPLFKDLWSLFLSLFSSSLSLFF